MIFLSIICSSLSFITKRILFHGEKREFEYDHSNLGFLFSTVYGFLFAVPAGLTIGMKLVDVETSFIKVFSGHQNLCFYGYSFMCFVLVSSFVWYPSLALRIISMSLACLYSFVRLAFIFMSYSPVIQQSNRGIAQLQSGQRT